MNYTYLVAGIISLFFGLWLTVNQIKIFIKGKQDELGWDIKGLGLFL